MITRSQEDLAQAIKLVGQVAQQSEKRQAAYGRLCHGFPIMVRLCGLCQAVAFSEAKSQSDQDTGKGANTDENKWAHGVLLKHVAEMLGETGAGSLSDRISRMPVERYMQCTSQVLRKWIFFKRLAVSVLKVETGEEKASAGEQKGR